MSRIFDNMDLTLVSALRENLPAARRVDVSVGYFNLRGWRPMIDRLVEAPPMTEVLAVSQWECNTHRTAIVDADLVYIGTYDAPSEAW